MQDVVGDQRRSAVGDERERDPGEGKEPHDAGHDEERLEADDDGQAGAASLANSERAA